MTLRVFGIALCLALASTGAAAQIAVARVNGVEITVEALDRGFEQELRARNMNIARMQRPAKVKEIKREVLERLIREELLWQKAREDGTVVSEAEAAQAVEQTAARFKTRAAFERRVASEGFDQKSYRDYARRMLSADRAAQSIVERGLALGDDDVEKFYRDNRALFHRPERLRLREILLATPPGTSPEAREAARAKAEGLRARLLAGEDFADLATRYSDAPTRPWSGALDPVARGQLAAPLEEPAFALKPGEVAPVIETPAGFYVLRLEERIAEETVSFEAVREQIGRHLRERRGRELLDREVAALRAASKIELLLPL